MWFQGAQVNVKPAVAQSPVCLYMTARHAALGARGGLHYSATTMTAPSSLQVTHLRQILLWPLRLVPARHPEARARKPWQVLRDLGDKSPWREGSDEYTGDPAQFHERHYNEFVTFLPYVQRFLYGEGRNRQRGGDPDAGSPMHVFRRHDVRQARLTLSDATSTRILVDIVHVDLYFFLDADLVLLNLEVGADNLSLAQAQELMHRFGRGYPAGWQADGRAWSTMANVEWLDAQGEVLASSDASQRELFLEHVARHRAPRIAAHWAWMLRPLVSDHSDEEGLLRYRQIEYYRMPMMAFLAMDDPRQLTRSHFVRLGLVTGADGAAAENAQGLPYGEQHLSDFEQRYCYDRFWSAGGAAPFTRYLCTGHSLVVVGQSGSQFYTCGDRGVLAQFRHQHFLVFLIAHFQKAALLMFSDKLVEALMRLRLDDLDSVRRFKRSIRGSFGDFLRFTHRYWFHEVAEQAQSRALFKMMANNLGLDPLYAEVKERIADMNSYLEADALRRQANTVVRLTVVTIFGLIGTVTTGFLGMNLLAEADAPLSHKLLVFGVVFVATLALTVYTMAKSKRLSDFLDALSDERLTAWQKLRSLALVWRNPPDEG